MLAGAAHVLRWQLWCCLPLLASVLLDVQATLERRTARTAQGHLACALRFFYETGRLWIRTSAHRHV